jgi:hypothetical protein
MRLEVEK